jgi:hypothetical protein
MGLLIQNSYFFSDEAVCALKGNVNSQSNRFNVQENRCAVYSFPLHDLKLGVWCTVSAYKFIGPVFFKETINSCSYIIFLI